MVQGHITHLNCRCRVLGDGGVAMHVQSRFRAVADQALLGAYEAALDQVLGDDVEVIVIRRIDAPLAVLSSDIPTDAAFARLWGERLAGSVMRRLAASTDDTEALIRFTDQAEYVARFICDLLARRAWDRWYYGAFSPLKNLTPDAALCRVLLDNPESIARVLILLRRWNEWDGFIEVVGDAGLRTIWHTGVRGLAASDVEVLLRKPASAPATNPSDASASVQIPIPGTPVSGDFDKHTHKRNPQAASDEARNKDRDLFLQICRLIDRLDLWVDKHNPPDTLFTAYRPRRLVDWRDRVSLGAAVCDMIDYLAKAGRLKTFTRQIPLERVQAIEHALRDYDWLDTDRLRASLFAALRGQHIEPAESRLTPRQRRLIEDLLKVLGRGVPKTLSVPAQAPALTLFLYSALIESAPQWKNDTLAMRLVEAVAFVRTMGGAKALGAAIHEALVRGDAGTLIEILPETTAPELREGLSLLAFLGEEVSVLIESNGDSSPGRIDTALIETPCAGVLLLLRAVADLRLPGTAARLGYPRQNDDHANALLLPLFMRLAGEGALIGERIDPALRVLFDPLERFDLKSLRDVWDAVDEASHRALEAALLKQLAGQRLFKGAVLQLFIVNTCENTLSLIAGDEDSGLWPMGRMTQGEHFQAGAIASMLEAVAQARGAYPRLIVAEQDRSCLGEALAAIGDAVDLHVIEADAQDAPATSYRRNRQALEHGLQVLRGAGLNSARADLALGLTGLSILRVWARWLRRFADAGAPHLFDQMLRRSGVLRCDRHVVDIELQPAPLDVIVEMAGYFGKIEALDILGGRDVIFRIRRSS